MSNKLFNTEEETKNIKIESEVSAEFLDDAEETFLGLIDYTPKSKVEIGFKNNSSISFFYWTEPKEFIKLWNNIKGNKVCLVACNREFITLNKKDVLYKRVSQVSEGQ